MTIQEMLERKRELGYSYEKLSELSGVPIGTLQKVLGGVTKSPRYDTLLALERVLDPMEPCMLRDNTVVYGAKRPGEYTIEDYYEYREEKRCELIDGVIYDMATPALIHQLIGGEIYTRFYNYIRSKNGSCITMMSPVSVQLDMDNRTMVEPDVIINCDRDKLIPKVLYGVPDLIVEILSPSTSKKDKTLKLKKYLDAGVREYWIVDPKKKCIITYTDDGQDDYDVSLYSFEDIVPVHIFDGECKVDFKEIYDYIGFMYEKENEKTVVSNTISFDL